MLRSKKDPSNIVNSNFAMNEKVCIYINRAGENTIPRLREFSRQLEADLGMEI